MAFTGRDWTKYTNDEKPSFMQKLANLNPFRKTNFRTEEDKLKHKKRQQIFIGSVATIVLIIFVVMYLIIFEFSNVDINITKKQAGHSNRAGYYCRSGCQRCRYRELSGSSY